MKRAEVTSLGSGSKGNATLFRFGTTLLLIDIGFSCKELERRLLLRGVTPSDVTAIVVTHEHSDHFNGVPTFSNKYHTPVWMSHGTSLHKNASKLKYLNLFSTHSSFRIDEVDVHPVLVPHDAREACQFVLKYEHRKMGILTDLGHITPYIEEQYQNCEILLLEFNHEPELLLNSAYPDSLKKRVIGNLGHLSNDQASQFLTDKITRKLKYLVAMHLSEENNKVDLVLSSILSRQLDDNTQVLLAHQNKGFDWIHI